jgi:DNA-binding CsgD family transcriptional regulator
MSLVVEVSDLIYEAALIPEKWPLVLDRLASMCGAVGGVLFAATDRKSAWTASASLTGAMNRFVADGWAQRNSRVMRGFEKGQQRFVTEEDLFEPGEVDNDPIYTEFFRPNGMGWSAGTGVQVPNGDLIVLSVERAYDLGPVDPRAVQKLQVLRADLSRAAMIAARLAFERCRTAVETLTFLGLPAAAVTKAGSIVCGNDEFLAEQDLWKVRAHDRIAIVSNGPAKLLAEALETIELHQGVRSFPVWKPESQDRAVLHVIPIRRSAHDLFAQSVALVVLTKPRSHPTQSLVLLQGLFDLTPAEASIAARIAVGESIASIATVDGKSDLTVRSQLKAILQKTGCSRQAELVSLLANLLPASL